ncbi:hypothetical protein OESDEN_05756 [Oesophagostomum dentatum]|uniref:Pre-rRNA-processing protein TSR2 homolog n=1 Tax=Oesophagostomum dentatum TaxID=61180 RepID=A0A0B1TAM4_OESDE|nr:hypothetical protein OESDEN_05756 [Oesophagostomum dentatum]
MASAAINPDEWRSIVNRVVNSWGGYQLGVDFNSGGPETLAKDEWLKDILAEYILVTRGLKAEDLEDWLNNILYTEFNLILEDESVYPTSLFLLEAFGTGLENFPFTLQANKHSQREPGDDDDEMELGDISESDDSERENLEEEPKRERQPRMVTDEEGWTTVLKR